MCACDIRGDPVASLGRLFNTFPMPFHSFRLGFDSLSCEDWNIPVRPFVVCSSSLSKKFEEMRGKVLCQRYISRPGLFDEFIYFNRNCELWLWPQMNSDSLLLGPSVSRHCHRYGHGNRIERLLLLLLLLLFGNGNGLKTKAKFGILLFFLCVATETAAWWETPRRSNPKATDSYRSSRSR